MEVAKMGHRDLNFTQHIAAQLTWQLLLIFFDLQGLKFVFGQLQTPHLASAVGSVPTPHLKLPNKQKPDNSTLFHMLWAALWTESLGSHAAW